MGPLSNWENKELGYWGVSGLDKLVLSLLGELASWRISHTVWDSASLPSPSVGVNFFSPTLAFSPRVCPPSAAPRWPVSAGKPGRHKWSPCRDIWTSSPKPPALSWAPGETVVAAVWSSPNGLSWITRALPWPKSPCSSSAPTCGRKSDSGCRRVCLRWVRHSHSTV